jgi:hypothetical protein
MTFHARRSMASLPKLPPSDFQFPLSSIDGSGEAGCHGRPRVLFKRSSSSRASTPLVFTDDQVLLLLRAATEHEGGHEARHIAEAVAELPLKRS